MATIPANDREPLWKLPSTGSRPPSGHPLPAHERAARLLVRIELLPTPERCRMALQNAPNVVRMGSPEGRTGLRLRGGGKSVPRSPPSDKNQRPCAAEPDLGCRGPWPRSIAP